MGNLLNFFFKFYYILDYFVCIYGGVCMCHYTHMEVRGSLLSVGQESSTYGQVLQQVPLPLSHLTHPQPASGGRLDASEGENFEDGQGLL